MRHIKEEKNRKLYFMSINIIYSLVEKAVFNNFKQEFTPILRGHEIYI